MDEYPIVVFEAGATRSCGGPLTGEILPKAFEVRGELEREEYFAVLNLFLVENFNLPETVQDRKTGHSPPLPLLISLLDNAIDHKHSYSPNWAADRLVEVRGALDAYDICPGLGTQGGRVGPRDSPRGQFWLLHRT
jgi:hypothetical protein